MREYAEKEKKKAQPRRMLISSFNLTDGTIITLLLLFYLKLGLVCKKIHRFVQYTPRNSFGNFVQSAVDARRQGDKNPKSSVVAETMKLLASSSYGYQIMDCSRHTVTKYLTDEKTHSAINSKMFKRPNHITDQLNEVELVKLEIEHREANVVGFFILQHAKHQYAKHTRHQNRVSSKKSLHVQKCCVSVAKPIVVMISVLRSTSSAANGSIREHWKSVAMVDQCQNIAKC